jgi:hypothetical protein
LNFTINADQISILLTATVDPKGIAFMERANPAVRLSDYCSALERWVADPWVRNIVLVENSGYPLDEFRRIAGSGRLGKNVELIGFDGQDFSRDLGKGYGEGLALTHLLEHSMQLRTTNRFVKVNGRYHVPNVGNVLASMTQETQIFCNITRSLTFADSRFFGGDRQFLKRVCIDALEVNDQKGISLEHTLARSMLRGIADGLSWQFIATLPDIHGIAGTLNVPYVESRHKRWLKGRITALKQTLLRL